jgi:hypothetical protein
MVNQKLEAADDGAGAGITALANDEVGDTSNELFALVGAKHVQLIVRSASGLNGLVESGEDTGQVASSAHQARLLFPTSHGFPPMIVTRPLRQRLPEC